MQGGSEAYDPLHDGVSLIELDALSENGGDDTQVVLEPSELVTTARNEVEAVQLNATLTAIRKQIKALHGESFSMSLILLLILVIVVLLLCLIVKLVWRLSD